MASLPPLSDIQSSPSSPQSPLAVALDILFEHSPIITTILEPRLHEFFKSSPPLESYTQFIDIALDEIAIWDTASQANFISGHPRIGESKNLSKLSATEQGAGGVRPTPPEVLARLAHLNVLFEVKYPGLRYITFVNGRTRATIAEEMENFLDIPHSLSPSDPDVGSLAPVNVEDKEWKDELSRAVGQVGLIAKSRLKTLGGD